MVIFVIAVVRPLVLNVFFFIFYYSATSVGEFRFDLHYRQFLTYMVQLNDSSTLPCYKNDRH